MKSPTWLQEHRSDVFSQTGEDGVIAKILETLPERDGWCVEFGAWDGRRLSCTANLVVNKGYSCVFIEADAGKFEELKSNYADNAKVIPLNRLVGYDANDNLDSILAQTPIPAGFDFLSIDIDGNDYYVWQAVSKYRPKIVCIEFNPTIPTEVDFVQEKGPEVRQGCSVAAAARLGKEMGYELVCVLPWNAIFVRREYFPLFEIADNSVKALRTDDSLVTYLFVGFDGKVLLRGAKKLPWHGMRFTESSVQVLPAVLQRNPLDYSFFQRQLFTLVRFVQRVRARLSR